MEKVPWTTHRCRRARWALFATQHKPAVMQQLHLPHIPVTLAQVDHMLGLTAFMLVTEQPPPAQGWWLTSRPHPFTGEWVLPVRRWWDGDTFSRGVNVGDSDRFADESKALKLKKRRLQGLYWCGLREPHPESYLHKEI